MFFIQALVVLFIVSSAYGDDKGVHERQDVGIIGGHSISIESVPYMASLRINGTSHWCGGSIIHERFILTAAHCIKPNRKYKVIVGTDRVDGKGPLYDVEKILIHKKYSNKTNDYDICILKLNKALTFGPKVKKIVLETDALKLKEGTILNTTGWGITKRRGHVSEYLQQVSIPLVSETNCNRAYVRSIITPRRLCAGGRGKDTCLGDSGGPLTWNNVQVGLTSFGGGCGLIPSIYTKISALYSWITETMKKNL